MVGPGTTTEIHHFIGKDITYFHTLFWPAMLDGAGFRLPKIHIHGFLTVNGEKMSKSGDVRPRATYLKHLDPAYLRYYYASKLNAKLDDLDLNLDEFVAKVNADLVGKVVNLASRCAGFITRQFAGQTAPALHDAALWARFREAAEGIAEHFEHVTPRARYGKSPPSRTSPTSTSPTRPPGHWQKTPRATPTCRRSAPWASNCSGC